VNGIEPPSNFVVGEDVILLATGALCAFQAADEKNSHTQGHEDGKQIRVRHKPMDNTMHKLALNTSYSKLIGRSGRKAGLSPGYSSLFSDGNESSTAG
jgi:hypothetical protein